MQKKIWWLLVLLGMMSAQLLFGQTNRVRELRKINAAPEEIISLSQSTSFSNALVIINDLSQKYYGKVIVGREVYNGPIGVDIDKMHWLSALEIILRRNGLWYNEYPDYIQIVPQQAEEPTAEVPEAVDKVREEFEKREVVISAVFFEADVSKLREAGMSWNLFRGKDVDLNIRNTSVDNTGGLLEIEIDPDLDFGDITAIFKALESDQMGEIVTSPKITVKSGEEGRIQVGSDIAITLQDFSGNTITQFFSTGSIIKVKPNVVMYDSIHFINLSLEIERSNSSRGDAGLEIKKSMAKTSVMLLDGEETVIGGLNVNEEGSSRDGIPFLKDLPWWLFGLRYVFGHESHSVVKKELLILLKGELLPTLKERFENKRDKMYGQELLKEKRRENRLWMEYYRKQVKESQK